MKLTMGLLIGCLALALGMSSCAQNLDTFNEEDWSVEQSSENPVIDNKVGDIRFKFCLLNKDSVPTTVFKQGEVIHFYFDIMNVSEELITVKYEKVLSEQDFCMVYQAGTDVQAGKPWSGKFCEFIIISNPYYEIPVNNSITYILPWYKAYNEGIILNSMWPFCCMGQELFPSGEYSCRFKTDFIYQKNGKEKKIKGLSFKINFKIIES